jgi:hypothetical protein
MKTTILSKEVSGTDLMTAIAIVVIVFTQFYSIFPQGNTMFSQIVSMLHFLSIETFLVLSGFTIGRTLLNVSEKREADFSSILQFLKSSFLQIIPFYFFALVLNYLLARAFNYPTEYSWKYLFFAQNFQSPMPAFFSESWIIPIVVFASLFLSFSLYFYYKLFKKDTKKSFLAVGILGIFVGLFLKWNYHFSVDTTTINQWDRGLKSVVIYRLDSVCIGALFYGLNRTFNSLWLKFKKLLLILGVLGIFFIFFGIGYFRILIDTYSFFWNVFYLPVVSLSIAFFIPFFSELKIESTFFKPITLLSSLFYPIYLLHFSSVLQTIKHFYSLRLLTSWSIFLVLFFYMFITFSVSWILFLMVKRFKIQ